MTLQRMATTPLLLASLLATMALMGVLVDRVESGQLPRYGGNVRIILNDIPTDLFPHRLSGDSGELVGSNLYEGLTRFSGRGIVPSLATTWVRSDDAKRWVFRLRRNVSFHDGTPCNAAAVP